MDMTSFSFFTSPCSACHPGGGSAEFDREGKRYDLWMSDPASGFSSGGDNQLRWRLLQSPMERNWRDRGGLPAVPPARIQDVRTQEATGGMELPLGGHRRRRVCQGDRFGQGRSARRGHLRQAGSSTTMEPWSRTLFASLATRSASVATRSPDGRNGARTSAPARTFTCVPD